MKKSDKTKTYSDSNKTSIYGDSVKLTKKSVHNLKAGDKIVLKDKEYLIIEIISESTGEAVIYKVKDTEKNTFALKLYYEFHNAENEPNTEALTRIQNIEDEDILKLIDFGTGVNKFRGKYCYEISDFAHGFDLLSIESIKEKYSLYFIEKELIPQIFKGILRLHNHKIYHCDLKPQNVFYLDKEQKEIVIGDYGSAKTFEFDAAKSSRKTTTVKGTDFYLPPEQARGFISEKNDYYSFGMVLLHLVYPEKILLNEDEPKSLSHAKLKQIIERQFEAKPIIDFNSKYKRINSFIEGLTLVDFNLRWGENEVKAWIEGKSVEVYYKKEILKIDDNKYSEKTLILENYKINSVYDLRAYILNEQNWYADLLEDDDNRKRFMAWFLILYEGDRSKRSVFNRIVKNYSQDGIDFIADAIIRFFIPEHPVSIGLKSFNFAETDDVMKSTALAFSHLIFDLWDNSSQKDIKQFIFSYEFALRQIKNQAEAHKALKILYLELSINENVENDFKDYKVYAYTKVNKESLELVKKFLTELTATDIEIEIISLDRENNLSYNVNKSTLGYFKSIGIDRAISYLSITDQTIALRLPESSKYLDVFIEETFENFIEDFKNKHNITYDISPNSAKKIKESLKLTYIKILKNTKNELTSLKNEFSARIKKIYGFSTDFNTINNFLQNIKYDKARQTYNDIITFKEEIKKVFEAKEILRKCFNMAKKSSLARPFLKEAAGLIKTNNYKEIEKAWQILTKKHSFESRNNIYLENKGHRQISYEKIKGIKKIESDLCFNSLTMSPNGDYFVTTDDEENSFTVYSPHLKIKKIVYKNLDFNILRTAISNDGKKIACMGDEIEKVIIYDFYSEKTILTLEEQNHIVENIAFSYDEKYLAAKGNSKLLIWNLKNGKVEKVIDSWGSFCFHPFKSLVAFGNSDKEITLINISTDEQSIISGEHTGIIWGLCFSPDGKLIASKCDNILRIWDVKTGELVHTLVGQNESIYSDFYFSPNGKFLAAFLKSDSVRFWCVTTGKPVFTLKNFRDISAGLAFHPDNEYIVIAYSCKLLLIYFKNLSEIKIKDFIIFENEQSLH